MLKKRAKENAGWGWTNGQIRFNGGPKGRRGRVCKGSRKAAVKMAEAMEEWCQATGKCFRPRTGPRKTPKPKKGIFKKASDRKKAVKALQCAGGACLIKPNGGGLLTPAPSPAFTPAIPPKLRSPALLLASTKPVPRVKNKFPHGPARPLPPRPSNPIDDLIRELEAPSKPSSSVKIR